MDTVKLVFLLFVGLTLRSLTVAAGHLNHFRQYVCQDTTPWHFYMLTFIILIDLFSHKFQERPREIVVGIGGPTGLWNFIYRSIYLDQYVSSEFASPISLPSQQKRLYRAYQRLYASMHDKGVGPHKTQFIRDEDYGKGQEYFTMTLRNFIIKLSSVKRAPH